MKSTKKKLLTHPLTIYAVHAITWALASTYRFHVKNQAPWLRHLSEGGRVLICGWHQQFYPAVYWLRRFSRFRPAIMVSRSEDGDIAAGIADLNGWVAIRGSSSKGGVPAMARMVKTLRDYPLAGHILDGPRGPAGRVKPGVLQMARLTGAVLVPMGISADMAWHANSWDRFMIPKPFSRVTIRFGHPIRLGRDALKKTLDHQLRDVESVMRQIGGFAAL